jgi:hypothetical protein
LRGSRVITSYVALLKCKLTEPELLDRGQSLAHIEGEMRAHTKHADAVKKELKSKEASIEAELARLGNIVRDKSEPRETTVQVEQVGPREVEEIRADTGEVVTARLLREEERQEELFVSTPLRPVGKDDEP